MKLLLNYIKLLIYYHICLAFFLQRTWVDVDQRLDEFDSSDIPDDVSDVSNCLLSAGLAYVLLIIGWWRTFETISGDDKRFSFGIVAKSELGFSFITLAAILVEGFKWKSRECWEVLVLWLPLQSSVGELMLNEGKWYLFVNTLSLFLVNERSFLFILFVSFFIAPEQDSRLKDNPESLWQQLSLGSTAPQPVDLWSNYNYNIW